MWSISPVSRLGPGVQTQEYPNWVVLCLPALVYIDFSFRASPLPAGLKYLTLSQTLSLKKPSRLYWSTVYSILILYSRYRVWSCGL